MAVTAVTAVVASASATTALTAASYIGFAAGLGAASTIALGSALAFGVGAIAGQVIGAPINAALGLGPQAAPSSVGAAQAQGLLINATSNVAPVPVVYGSRTVGGTMVMCQVSGASNEFLHLVICLSEGEISAINNVYLNGLVSTDAKYSGLVTVEKYLGTDTQSASAALMAALPGVWTAAHQGKGIAYVYVRCQADSTAFSGLPTITADIDGKLVFDPRSSTTGFSHNPALCSRDYLTNARYGCGLDPALVDDASFIAAANFCKTSMTIPTGTQQIYTCDGVVNVNQTVYQNMMQILSSCNGMLIFSGGKYRLVIEKAETPTSFGFTEDNITGAWKISLPGKNTATRAIVNRITASFFNPANKWQPDLAIQDSAAYRAQDNGVLLESKIDLPYTADIYRAQAIAQMAMKRSRVGTLVQFNAFQEGLKCEVGDVVPITHSTPGWVAQPFRILTIDILSTDEVQILACEYSDQIYVMDAMASALVVPQTNLPDPFVIGLPGLPYGTESLYLTRNGAGVKSMLSVACSAALDAFVIEYEFQHQLVGASVWINDGIVRGPSVDLLDIAPGAYNLRVRARNAMGITSAWQQAATQVYGLSAAPSNLAGLAIHPVSALAVLTWTQSGDLDVLEGGSIIVRHSPVQTGATWETSTTYCDPLPGAAISVTLPLVAGTYLIRPQDSSGNLSPAASMIASDGSTMFAYATVTTVQEDSAFVGALTNVYVDTDIGRKLELCGNAMFDSAASVDAIINMDYAGGVKSSGTYGFASGIDLGAVLTKRLVATLSATAENVIAIIDSRTALVDTWVDFDGTAGASVDAWVEMRSTQDNPGGSPTWSAWRRFAALDINARAFQFRAQLVSNDPAYNIAVDQLRVRVEG